MAQTRGLIASAIAVIAAYCGSGVAEARFLQVDPVGYKDQVNLYAYVNNDPVGNRDPTGEECVNGPNGTTKCVGTGYNVSFATPQGFQNTNPKASDYHQYAVPNQSPRSAPETREWVRNNPTPGWPAAATAKGTYNDATPGIGNPLTYISPVISFSTVNAVTGNEVVVNATLPGHPLGNGIVVRDTVSDPKGASTIMNYGEGNGRLLAPSSRVAEPISNVWAGSTMRPPDPKSAPYDRCVLHPGSC
jgi:hypothetical protein